MTFEEFYLAERDIASPVDILKSRRYKGYTGLNRKKQNILPQTHRSRTDIPKALQDLYKQESGRKILTPSEAQQIKTKYHVGDIEPGFSKSLTNTGIKLYFDGSKYVLTK